MERPNLSLLHSLPAMDDKTVSRYLDATPVMQFGLMLGNVAGFAGWDAWRTKAVEAEDKDNEPELPESIVALNLEEAHARMSAMTDPSEAKVAARRYLGTLGGEMGVYEEQMARVRWWYEVSRCRCSAVVRVLTTGKVGGPEKALRLEAEERERLAIEEARQAEEERKAAEKTSATPKKKGKKRARSEVVSGGTEKEDVVVWESAG
jgi:hypothetical protein